MNPIPKILAKLDSFQRRYKPTAFVFAVIKKYGDDQAGYQAALVTYYGFLSLFPLLLILSTVAGIVSSRDPAVGRQLIDSVSDYFPVIGTQLEESVRSSAKSGVALVIGLLFSLYGARGVANAFRDAVNHIWHVPLAKRSGFPRSLLRNVILITGGGLGFILASTIAGWAKDADRGIIFQIISIVLNLLILYLVFIFILRVSLPLKVHPSKFRVGAAVCAVGLTLLQRLGFIILGSVTPSSYSALFATTLGLLAWIYLQAQVIMYATVIDTVRNDKLYPRGLTEDKPTPADKKMIKRRLEA
jgi:inner membrane protein YhjD